MGDYGGYPLGFQRSWAYTLAQYFGVNKTFQPLVGQAIPGLPECPGYLRLPGLVYRTESNTTFMSYGYNSGGGLLYGTNDPLPRGLSRTYEQQIARPSQMIALADGIPIHRISGLLLHCPVEECYAIDSKTLYWGALANIPTLDFLFRDPNFKPLTTDQILSRAAIKRRHGGKWNVLFCDQHIESQTTSGLWDVRKREVARRWNRDNLPHNEALGIRGQ